MSLRLVISTNVVPPYRVSLFNALSARLEASGGALTVVAWTPDMVGRGWSVVPSDCAFRLIVAGTRLVGRETQISRLVIPKLASILLTTQYDALVTTGFGPESMLAVALGRAKRAAVFLWSEAVGGSDDYDDSWLRLQQRRLLGHASTGVVVPGKAAAAYAKRFNRNLLVLRNTVDVDVFAPRRAPGASNILTVGQLRHYRNHRLLIEPIRRAIADGLYDRWILVGDGPERETLIRECRSILGDTFEHIPHRSPSEIAELLGHARCFASIPSRDIWGFAVQEAVMAGVPVVATPNVGCGADLLSEHGGGYVTSTGPVATGEFAQDVYEGLARASTRECQQRSARAAAELRGAWTPERAAEDFLDQLLDQLRDGQRRSA